jgi:nitrilase
VSYGTCLNPGQTEVVRPGCEIAACPLREQHGLLYADLDVGRVASERRTLDVVGHYARNDVFRLVVDRTPRQPLSTSD